MRKILIYTIVLGALMLSSCNDWLDVTPRDRAPEKELFKDASGFNDALIACYIKLASPGLYGASLTAREIDVMAQYWSFGVDTEAGAKENTTKLGHVRDFKYTEEYPVTLFKSVFADLYNVIVQANAVIKNIEDNGHVIKDQQLKDVIKAEAHAIRAFCHMDVLRLFGQLPQNGIMKVSLPYSVNVSKEAVPYYDYETFALKILEDLNIAEALLKDNDPLLMKNIEGDIYKYTEEYPTEDFLSYRGFRFNYFGIQAFKARLYMYMGNNPTEARKYANLVIENSNLKLAGSEDLVAKLFSLPSECIVALSAPKIKSNIGKLFSANSFYMSTSNINTKLFAGQSNATNNRMMHLWNMNDSDNQSRTRPSIRKYSQTSALKGTLNLALYSEVIPLIRLSEMYLIMMETSESLAEINDYYDIYMEARGVARRDFTDILAAKSEIINEYRREFIGEGQMFYTYKRLNTPVMMFRSAVVSESHYVVPLPDSEYNPNI